MYSIPKMDKIRQFQVVNEIKPRFKRIIKPFYQSSPMKIKFIQEEFELQYQGMGLWMDEKNKSEFTGGDERDNICTCVVDLEF